MTQCMDLEKDKRKNRNLKHLFMIVMFKKGGTLNKYYIDSNQ